MKKFAAILLILSLLVGSYGFTASSFKTKLTGDSILKNEKITVTGEGKKALVVVFLSAKCPCSNSHIQELKSLAEAYKDFSFVAVNSNVDESLSFAKNYFVAQELPFPILRDQNTEFADHYHASKTPHAFIVLPSGELAYQGGVSSSHRFEKAEHKYLREALNDLQNNRKVKTPEGRALGCAISRGDNNVW